MTALLKHMRWITWRDPVRFGLQSAAGVMLTYFAAHLLGLPEISWAVMSALFVAHQNLEATLTDAAGRIGSTLLGTVLGLATVLMLPGADAAIWRLAFVALAMNGIAILLPHMQYGVVAAAVIVLPTGESVWGSAVDRGLAIALGSLVGTASAFLIWPETAAWRARRTVLAALATCRELLDASLNAFVNNEQGSLDALHQQFLLRLRDARELSGSARVRGDGIRAMVVASSRLWHTLIVLDRLQMQPGRRRHVSEDTAVIHRLEEVRDEVCGMLSQAHPGKTADSGAAVAAIRRAIDAVEASTARPALEPLAFALEELVQDLETLEKALGRC